MSSRLLTRGVIENGTLLGRELRGRQRGDFVKRKCTLLGRGDTRGTSPHGASRAHQLQRDRCGHRDSEPSTAALSLSASWAFWVICVYASPSTRRNSMEFGLTWAKLDEMEYVTEAEKLG